MGSGTTAIACIRTSRKYIGIELSKKYCEISEDRIKKETYLFNHYMENK